MLLQLKQLAAHQPDHIAIEDGVKKISYAQLWQEVQYAASKLSVLPIHAVALDLPNGSAWIIAHLVPRLQPGNALPRGSRLEGRRTMLPPNAGRRSVTEILAVLRSRQSATVRTPCS